MHLSKQTATKIGVRLSLHSDKPDGKELSFGSIYQLKKPQKTGADQKSPEWKIVGGRLTPEKGTHNIYIVTMTLQMQNQVYGQPCILIRLSFVSSKRLLILK